MMRSNLFILCLVISTLIVYPLSIPSVYADTPTTRQNIQDTCGGPINVRNSFIMSAVTLCLPGLLEKTYEYKQIKCEKAVCYYEAVVNGLDPSFCERQSAYKTCTYFVGEAFALPPMAMFDYLRNALAQALANPIAFVYSAAVLSARGTIGASCTVPILCNVKFPNMAAAHILVIVTDTTAIIQYFKDFAQNGLDGLGANRGQQDYCERLPEIREEMEDILAARGG